MFFFSLTEADAPHAYVRALTLCCFRSLISTQTLWRALTASLVSCGGKECPFSDVTSSGRVWRKVPESDARSVGRCISYGRYEQLWPCGSEGQSEPDLKRIVCQHRHTVETDQRIGFNLPVPNTACLFQTGELHPPANERLK